MSEKYNSIFNDVLNFVRGTPMAAWLLALSILILVIGINGFIEDTNSSYVGIQQLETAYGVRAVSYEATYLLMSLFFQVMSVIGFFFYLSNREKNWVWLYVSLATQLIDFAADVWYRSNGEIFQNVGASVVAIILTFVFFTVGSEVAISVGLGLTAKLFVEGMSQFAMIVRDAGTGIGKFFERMSKPSASNGRVPPAPQMQNNNGAVPHHFSSPKQKYQSPSNDNGKRDIMIVSGGGKDDDVRFR